MESGRWGTSDAEEALRVLHVTRYCHVATVGGTERYIQELIKHLGVAGVANEIIWLDPQEQAATVDGSGIRVWPIRISEGFDDPPLGGPESDLPQHLLLEPEITVVHFHTYGRAEAALARAFRRRGFSALFTYHSPAWTCRRETMLLWGKGVCDGQVAPLRCGACLINRRLGTSPKLSWGIAVASAPLSVLRPILRGGPRRLLTSAWGLFAFRRELREFLRSCARVVSCAAWSEPVLVRNGARSSQIAHVPQGLPVRAVCSTGSGGEETKGGSAFTVAYVGRPSSVKGIDIAVEAFVRTPYENARLTICGWRDDSLHMEEFQSRVRRIAEGDDRITFIPPQPFEEMQDMYAEFDLLLIPSVWPETGPLTLYEAIGAGVEPWGSANIGQLEELRRHGRVIEPNTADAWSSALAGAFERHRRGVWKRPPRRSVRTMKDVAADMHREYESVLRSH